MSLFILVLFSSFCCLLASFHQLRSERRAQSEKKNMSLVHVVQSFSFTTAKLGICWLFCQFEQFYTWTWSVPALSPSDIISWTFFTSSNVTARLSLRPDKNKIQQVDLTKSTKIWRLCEKTEWWQQYWSRTVGELQVPSEAFCITSICFPKLSS